MTGRKAPSPMLMAGAGAAIGMVFTLVGSVFAWSAGVLVDAPGAILRHEQRLDAHDERFGKIETRLEEQTRDRYTASQAHRDNGELKEDIRELRTRLREVERGR